MGSESSMTVLSIFGSTSCSSLICILLIFAFLYFLSANMFKSQQAALQIGSKIAENPEALGAIASAAKFAI